MGFLPSWIENHLPDADEVFAYDTVKLVRILDRRLGFVYWGIQALVAFYMIVIVFIINKAYQDTEKSTGWMLTKVVKPQISHLGISWDAYDRITNPGESGAVFVPTRILITRGQTQEDEYCESPSHPCKEARDCNVGDPKVQKMECQNGFCMRRQWCPAENANWPTTETHYLDFEKVELWFKSYVHYHKFGLDVSTADEKESIPYPHRCFDTTQSIPVVLPQGTGRSRWRCAAPAWASSGAENFRTRFHVDIHLLLLIQIVLFQNVAKPHRGHAGAALA
eukprot:s559_g13.t2